VRPRTILSTSVFVSLLLVAGVCVPAAGPETTGVLKVNSDPEGATVEVDSGQKGITPTMLEVPAGLRKVRICRDGYVTQSQEVIISPDGIVRLQLKLMLSLIATVTERRGKDQAEMVLIPEGKFLRGVGEGSSEKTFLKVFWIDKHEVTNAQYARFMQEIGHRKPAYWEDPAFNQPSQPVVGVSWEDAISYARWAGKRLPSEVEWEKAARGVDGRIYPWGNAWGPDRCNSWGGQDGFEGPAPVGSFPSGASPYGVMDMAGNVWEWVADEPNHDASADVQSVRIGRGGSWANPPEGVKVISQAKGDTNLTDCIIGFRCALDGP